MTNFQSYTRQEILTLLKLSGALTAEEIGQELNISGGAARQYVIALVTEGTVATIVERRGTRRPIHKYVVSSAGDESFARSYDDLSLSLIDEIKISGGDEMVDKTFDNINNVTKGQHQFKIQRLEFKGRVNELCKM